MAGFGVSIGIQIAFFEKRNNSGLILQKIRSVPNRTRKQKMIDTTRDLNVLHKSEYCLLKKHYLNCVLRLLNADLA